MFDIECRARPILKWAGGKSGILEQMIPHFPSSFERYFEPFFGGGAVFFASLDGTSAMLNDANDELINLYSVVRDHPHELMAALDSHSKLYCEEYYYEVRSYSALSRIERAARTVFLNKTGFNGLYRQNSSGGFNVPFGKRPVCPALFDKENLLSVSIRLKQAVLSTMDFEDHMSQARAGDFVYCDPPYEPLSTTSSFNAYKGGGFTQADQSRLKVACIAAQKRGAFVAVSNSSAPFIKSLYSECEIMKIAAKRAINSKGDKRGEVEELLVLFDPLISQSRSTVKARIKDAPGLRDSRIPPL
jgi:DNA adenine methylase